MVVVKKREKFDSAMAERYNEGAMDMINREKRPFIIGLTGNIGSGKSSVLNMLRHLGAYGIDADEAARKAHRVPEIQESILAQFGTTDPGQLAEIVFAEPAALRKLENIIHPMVTRMAEELVESAALPVIVIEAVKLLESDLAAMCDSIWVVHADDGQVIKRLAETRDMTESAIRARLKNQSPLKEKMKQADVLIENDGSPRETWDQVMAAWDALQRITRFRVREEKTSAMLTEFSPCLPRPFTPQMTNITDEIRAFDNAAIRPDTMPANKAGFTKQNYDLFLFISRDTQGTLSASSWNLSTWHLSLNAVVFERDRHDAGTAILPLDCIERFARIHRVESLLCPVDIPFNNTSRSAFETCGFRPCKESGAAAAEWHKAGYNVFYKQYWDITAALKDRNTA